MSRSGMPDDRHVILTGFMGAGKSSVGRCLAGRLDIPFIDLDAEIVAEAGMPITGIFAAEGEQGFRITESRVLARLLGGGSCVLATGGGAVIAEGNRRLMRECGVVVNLKVSLESVIERLAGCGDRPLYSGQDPVGRARQLMESREQFYSDADIRIDTNGKSVEDVAAEILDKLKDFHP